MPVVRREKLENIRRIQRRRILAAALSAPVATVPGLAQALPVGRALSFSHTHTGERLKVTYFENGRYLPDALGEINYLLRDFRTREICPIEPALLDFVHQIQATAGSSGTIEIISGYRSPTTNEMLRETTSGVAKKSFHMSGRAIDIRVTDLSTDRIRDAAMCLGMGGVGYYRTSDFIHVDLGPARYW